MKSKFARRLSVMLLCLLLAFTMLLSACTPADPTPPEPDDQEKPGDNENKEPGTDDPGTDDPGNKEDPPVDDGFVKLTDKGNLLYNATYQTMLDRLMQDGYAQTSLTGAYNGMFVRDASIQVMAHIAEGDMDAAMRILKFMAAYHKAIGAEHAIHIMDELRDEYLYDYVVGEKTPLKPASGSTSQNVSQMDYETALYKIVLPNNQAAQTFSVPFDNIAEIAVALEISATAGKIHLLIGNEPGDGSVGTFEFDVNDVVKDGKWAKFIFDEPFAITPNQTYVFTVGAEISSGNVIAFGKLGAGGAYNYDLPAYGGWIQEAHAIGHQIRTDVSVTGEENAVTESFTANGNRIDYISILFTGSEEETTVHAKLTDASGNLVKEITTKAPDGTNVIDLNFDLAVTEGADYNLTVWADAGRTTWELASNEKHFMTFTPEYSGSKLSGSVTLGGSKEATLELPDVLTAKNVTSISLYLSALGTVGENDTVTVALYKGNVLVDEVSIPLSNLTNKADLHHFDLCLPLNDVDADEPYSVKVSASREGSVAWYGEKVGEDLNLSYTAGCSNIVPISKTVQVDGHYMWMNSFALFVLEAEANFKGQYDEFIQDAYPLMESYTKHFFETTGDLGGNVGFIEKNYGLMYTPSYEHSRDGRYWKAFDLITNVFCSEAAHKMGAVAKIYGSAETAEQFNKWADDLATAIHKELVYDFNGKDIYIDLIDVENGRNYDGYAFKTDEGYRVYKGFSFVNLAPLAAEWYAMNDEIMKNTYEAYFEAGSEKYGKTDKFDVLGVVVVLDKDNNTQKIGNHLIGKGFAWELHYHWQTGNTERMEALIAFMDQNSTDVYPEVWRKDGGVNDSANQEHANWILYTMARITGKYKAPVIE